MQATQSASGSRNRSLLMTLIMIVGALSPVLSGAATEGMGDPQAGPQCASVNDWNTSCTEMWP